MTPEDRNRLEELARKANNWHLREARRGPCGNDPACLEDETDYWVGSFDDRADLEFAAAANPEAILSLLSDLQEAQKKLASFDERNAELRRAEGQEVANAANAKAELYGLQKEASEIAANLRAFAQDMLDNGHLERGDLGNTMAIRDEADKLKALCSSHGRG